MLVIDTTCEPDNKAPYWVMGYLRRDVGTTRRLRVRHWRTVLLSDMSACIWNKMQHDFQYAANTELRRDWLRAHYAHVLKTAPIADFDRDLLQFKAYSHLQQFPQRQAA